MAEGGHKEEYIYPDPENDDLEWWAETRMNIRDVRSLYSSINYYQSIWPGPPERQENEQKFLNNFKIVNGIPHPEPNKMANGLGCLVAQYVAAFKMSAGDIYIEKVKENNNKYLLHNHKNGMTYGFYKTLEEAQVKALEICNF